MGYGEFMAKPIDQVAVLGAGVMGAAIAAHLANAGIKVLLLDIPAKDAPAGDRRARNKITAAGLERARKAKPASFLSPRFESLLTVGNLEDDLAAAARCDLVVEAIIEDLAVKRALYTRLEALGGSAVITSNTSGLRMKELLAGRSEDFRRRFCITHFFNPPRYLKLVEIVAGPDTAPETLARAEDLCGRLLGKGLVRAKDTPNFIANRIGTFALLRALDLAVKEGYSVEEVDMVFGPATGRPRSAVFRTADLVGIDTLVHVARHCHEALVDDDRREVFAVHPVLEELVKRKWLGSKTGQGFYKKQGDEILQLDLKTFEYVPLQKPRFPSIGATKGVEDIDERLRRMLGGAADDRAAALARSVIYETMAYSAARIPEIADDVLEVDRAMRWGFGWERGPFESWDALGLAATVEKMQAAKIRVPDWVKERIKAGETSFYRKEGPSRRQQLRRSGGYAEIPADPRVISLDAIRAAGGEVERNASASLLDIGDGVFCLEFHAKMNAIDADMGTLLAKAVDRAEQQGTALVIGNDGTEAFSAGANLFGLMIALGQGQMAAVEQMVDGFQKVNMRLRYARVPVVAAPFGLTLGGGVETMLGCTAVRAFIELYAGLVEVGVGLIPGGGGCMEMAARVSARAPDDPTFDLLNLLRGPFEAIGLAKVSTSAEEARDLGYLRPSDTTSMARETLIADAKQIALGLARAGYRPPPPRQIRVAGLSAGATLKTAIRHLVHAHRATEHDYLVVGKAAHVLCGGDVSAGAQVSEQYLLDLEREAFLSLCGEEKTRARIQHMLSSGKPLRN
jgi:3-hydroxyacyl-CoA dehydrogenase